MKKLKKLFPRLFRSPGARRGKKGSSLAFVMIIGAALVIWVMCIAPLMTTTGTVAYKTQGDQTVYLAGRSAIEFCKAELSRVVDSGEYPYTFCVVTDASGNYVAYKKGSDAALGDDYNTRVTRITDTDANDKKSVDDYPKTDDVVAICAVDMKADGSYDIVMTSWDNCEKGQEYHATFVPTGSLKIHPEAYSDGDALPLSDFVLVDGQLGPNTVWNSTITMNNAESLTFYESMLSSDKAVQEGFDLNVYANSGEYPAVFKTTAHTALAENSSVGEEISEGYMSSSETWIVPHCDTSKANTKGYVFLYGQQVWIRTADGNAGAGGANTLNITDKCTLYYNGNPNFFSGKINTYTVTVSYSGTDYSGELESGEVFTKYKEGEVNILPFSGFRPESGSYDGSGSVMESGKNSVSQNYSVQALEAVQKEKNGKTVTTYTVTLGHGKNEKGEIQWDNSLVYGCVKVNAQGNLVGETEWKTSNVFEGLEAPTEDFSYFFYVYKPDTYDAASGKITGASDVVGAGMLFKPTEVTNLSTGNYLIGNDQSHVLNSDLGLADLYSNLSALAGEYKIIATAQNNPAYTWKVNKSGSTYSIQSNDGRYLNINGTISEYVFETQSSEHVTKDYWIYKEKHSCNKRTSATVTGVSDLGISLGTQAQSFQLVDGNVLLRELETTIKAKQYGTSAPSEDCSYNENNSEKNFTLEVKLYLDLSGTAAAANKDNGSTIKFFKIPSTPSSTPARPTSSANVVESVNYKAAGFTLAELVTNSGTVQELYANGETIPMSEGKYYLNAGQYTIVFRSQVDGLSFWHYGTLKVNKNTTDNDPNDLNVTTSRVEEDTFTIHVEATGWHTDGGYHYFGFEEVGTGKIEWHSAVDVGYTFRLGFGTYNFYVKEVGSNNYGPVDTTEGTKVTQEIVMPVVSAPPAINAGMFWYTLDEDGEDTWYKLPQDVYPSRITITKYHYSLDQKCKNHSDWTCNSILGRLCRESTFESTDFQGIHTIKDDYERLIAVTKETTLIGLTISIDNPEGITDVTITLNAPMGQNQIGDHIASIMQGESLYFMGNPSINTHGNAVSLKTDLLVLNTQFTNDGVEGADNTISVQSYSGNSTIMVYAGANINNINGQQIFAAGHFYEIPSGCNLWSLTSAEVTDLGTADSQTVKAKFRNKEYPNINMDIANASREQLGRIVSSETIGWTDRGVLSGSNSESNAAYCVTAYVTNVSGNVKYKANRVMMAGAKENNYSLSIPEGMEITTRYLSIDADEVTGTSLMLYNLAQDQDFIQALSNVLGITNSYSQTLQVDYERPNTRIGGTNMISQICRYSHGTDLLAKAADKQSLIATYSVDLIESLFTGGLSGLASTVKTVDRYISIEPSGNDTTIDLSALLSVNLNMYANYVYFDPSVTKINLSSWLDSDVMISPQEDGYTTHEYLGLFQTHSADSYSGTILFFGNDLVVDYPSGSDVTIQKGFYRVQSGVYLSDFGVASNIGGEGSKIEAILLFSWDDAAKRAGIDKLRSYSVYIDPATGEFSDTYVDTGLDSNDSGGLGGFSGGKVQ